MIRRGTALLLAVLLLALTCSALAYDRKTAVLHYDGISIRLDGRYLTPRDAGGNEVSPFIIDGTTYLPIRAVASALGLQVDWEQATQTIRLTSGAEAQTGGHRSDSSERTVEALLKYPGITILLDGRKVDPKDVTGKTVDPFVIDGTTYLPIRAVASALGLKVFWEKETKTVLLYLGKTQAAAGPHPERAAYEAVLDEYRAFLTTPFGEITDKDDETDLDDALITERFPLVHYSDYRYWFFFAGLYEHPDWTFRSSDVAAELEFAFCHAYAFYDINGDGTDELLIRSTLGNGIGTIYSWNGIGAMVFLEGIGGRRAYSYIHKDGTVTWAWLGGAASENRWRVADDGYSADLIGEIEIEAEKRDTYADDASTAADAVSISWLPLFPEG